MEFWYFENMNLTSKNKITKRKKTGQNLLTRLMM